MKSKQQMDREFQEFVNSESLSPPPSDLTARVLLSVQKDLHPNAWWVFSKMSLIHLVSGIFTLSICPQFGVRFFGDGAGMMKYFMIFGHYGCVAACGAFFVGTSILLTGLTLRPEEVGTIRAYRLLQLSAVVFLSLGAFIMADAEILLGFALSWILGSLAGAMAMLELGWMIRKRLHSFT